jgi:hypothetical protein
VCVKHEIVQNIIGMGCIVHSCIQNAVDVPPFDIKALVVKIYEHFFVHAVLVTQLKRFLILFMLSMKGFSNMAVLGFYSSYK